MKNNRINNNILKIALINDQKINAGKLLAINEWNELNNIDITYISEAAITT